VTLGLAPLHATLTCGIVDGLCRLGSQLPPARPGVAQLIDHALQPPWWEACGRSSWRSALHGYLEQAEATAPLEADGGTTATRFQVTVPFLGLSLPVDGTDPHSRQIALAVAEIEVQGGGDGAAELGHAPLFARMASLSAEVLLDPRAAGSSIPLLRTFDRGSLRLTSLRVPSPGFVNRKYLAELETDAHTFTFTPAVAGTLMAFVDAWSGPSRGYRRKPPLPARQCAAVQLFSLRLATRRVELRLQHDAAEPPAHFAPPAPAAPDTPADPAAADPAAADPAAAGSRSESESGLVIARVHFGAPRLRVQILDGALALGVTSESLEVVAEGEAARGLGPQPHPLHTVIAVQRTLLPEEAPPLVPPPLFEIPGGRWHNASRQRKGDTQAGPEARAAPQLAVRIRLEYHTAVPAEAASVKSLSTELGETALVWDTASAQLLLRFLFLSCRDALPPREPRPYRLRGGGQLPHDAWAVRLACDSLTWRFVDTLSRSPSLLGVLRLRRFDALARLTGASTSALHVTADVDALDAPPSADFPLGPVAEGSPPAGAGASAAPAQSSARPSTALDLGVDGALRNVFSPLDASGDGEATTRLSLSIRTHNAFSSPSDKQLNGCVMSTDVAVQSLRVAYHHATVMRLWDFLSGAVLGALTAASVPWLGSAASVTALTQRFSGLELLLPAASSSSDGSSGSATLSIEEVHMRKQPPAEVTPGQAATEVRFGPCVLSCGGRTVVLQLDALSLTLRSPLEPLGGARLAIPELLVVVDTGEAFDVYVTPEELALLEAIREYNFATTAACVMPLPPLPPSAETLAVSWASEAVRLHLMRPDEAGAPALASFSLSGYCSRVAWRADESSSASYTVRGISLGAEGTCPLLQSAAPPTLAEGGESWAQQAAAGRGGDEGGGSGDRDGARQGLGGGAAATLSAAEADEAGPRLGSAEGEQAPPTGSPERPARRLSLFGLELAHRRTTSSGSALGHSRTPSGTARRSSTAEWLKSAFGRASGAGAPASADVLMPPSSPGSSAEARMRRWAGGDGVSQPDSHAGEGAGEDPYALPVLVPAKRSSGRVGLRGSFRRRSLSHDVSDPVARARLAPAIPEGAADVSVTRGRACSMDPRVPGPQGTLRLEVPEIELEIDAAQEPAHVAVEPRRAAPAPAALALSYDVSGGAEAKPTVTAALGPLEAVLLPHTVAALAHFAAATRDVARRLFERPLPPLPRPAGLLETHLRLESLSVWLLPAQPPPIPADCAPAAAAPPIRVRALVGSVGASSLDGSEGVMAASVSLAQARLREAWSSLRPSRNPLGTCPKPSPVGAAARGVRRLSPRAG